MKRRRCRIDPRVRRALLQSIALGLCGVWGTSCGKPDGPPSSETPAVSAEELNDERQRLDATVWSDEMAAQEYETAFIDLWDRLRETKPEERLVHLARGLDFNQITIGRRGAAIEVAPGIRSHPFTAALKETEQTVGKDPLPTGWTDTGESATLDVSQFRSVLEDFARKGYLLEQSEWHHADFSNEGDAPRSKVRFELHIANATLHAHFIVKGTLKVQWWPRSRKGDVLGAERIDATEVSILERAGPPVFSGGARFEAAAVPGDLLADPILLYDLSGDGFSEIIVAGRNEIAWNRDGRLSPPEKFCAFLPPIFETALLADFTGDGHADFACVGRDGVLRLFIGDAAGKFTGQPQVWNGATFTMPMGMTAGDLDGDGDLDLWVGQYKPPYQGGRMPTPYFDANDGHPAFLLENDGRGNFRDITEAAGLAAKRFRRTYGGSIVDLDDDGALDLVVTSDFSGIDLYRGDGKGHFTDVTREWVGDARHAFGMSHALADFDGDGKLDIYMTGMGSTTARRLDFMGLKREDHPEIHAMRAAMGYGNRMFLRRGDRFEEAEFKDDVARTGWSWGCSAFDFDNDGDRDLYVANGHQSGKSARDYCSTFWRHDLYLDASQPAPAVSEMLAPWMMPLRNGEISWNGYEHNALLMNRDGRGFLNIAYLAGVAFEFDARAVASDDLNGDGRVDLLVVENRRAPSGHLHQTLHVVANRFPEPGHWIGIRLREEGGGRSPLGARITVRKHGSDTPSVARIVTGDSLYAQHAPTVHFGLGSVEKVDSVEVLWPDGALARIDGPEIDRYHAVRPP